MTAPEVWKKDSAFVIEFVEKANLKTYEDCVTVIMNTLIYDMTISRAGIAHALGVLERKFGKKE